MLCWWKVQPKTTIKSLSAKCFPVFHIKKHSCSFQIIRLTRIDSPHLLTCFSLWTTLDKLGDTLLNGPILFGHHANFTQTLVQCLLYPKPILPHWWHTDTSTRRAKCQTPPWQSSTDAAFPSNTPPDIHGNTKAACYPWSGVLTAACIIAVTSVCHMHYACDIDVWCLKSYRSAAGITCAGGGGRCRVNELPALKLDPTSENQV